MHRSEKEVLLFVCLAYFGQGVAIPTDTHAEMLSVGLNPAEVEEWLEDGMCIEEMLDIIY